MAVLCTHEGVTSNVVSRHIPPNGKQVRTPPVDVLSHAQMLIKRISNTETVDVDVDVCVFFWMEGASVCLERVPRACACCGL